jgi:hypothetical protein
LAQGVFARSIEERIQQAGTELPSVLLKVRAHALAGALTASLQWWIDHKQPATPEEMDAQFHQLVWAGLGPPVS